MNASLAVAYHLAAAQGPEIEELLDQEIVVMTPGANPDGINRFASWVNSSRSFTNAINQAYDHRHVVYHYASRFRHVAQL